MTGFSIAASVDLDLDPRLEWLWYCARADGFVAGDARRAFLVPVSDPETPVPLQPSPSPTPTCNLPIPDALYDEFAAEDRRGFRFLSVADYARAVEAAGFPDGDLLRTIVFGPDYGTFFRHPASGMVLSLRAGSIQLLRQASGEGFVLLDQTRTRGKAALAFAAHPVEPRIVYGDNHGDFYAHAFSADAFGKARKIDSRGRKASALEFLDGGRTLVLGGMGYLAAYACDGDKFARRHEVTLAVRDFQWVAPERTLVVNQGMHGVALYRFDDDTGFTPAGDVAFGGAVVDVVAATHDLRAIAMLERYGSWPARARLHVARRRTGRPG